MIPISSELIRAIHEDRIREAQRRRPEWWYDEIARPARPSSWANVGRHLRVAVAQALRSLAATVEPKLDALNLESAAHHQQ
jgi:hypothetical protein